MENSVVSAIEKIKQQEIDNEAKLKEKREYEAAIASLHRKIREATTFVEKSQKDQVDLGKRIDKLRSQLQIDKIKRDSLLAQIDACKKELEELKRLSDEGISNVWNARSSLCLAIEKVSDEYDIWPLLMKPIPVTDVLQEEPLPYKEQAMPSDDRLKEALKRRDNLIAERDRLRNEPDISEEFVRAESKWSPTKLIADNPRMVISAGILQ